MRIIKFRSWHDGEMYDVDDLRFNVKGVSYAHLIQLSGRMLYHTPDMGKIELMQFTGLLDRSGKEIYEGDIVQVAHKPPFAIKDFSWWHGTEWEESCYGYDFQGESNKEVEVIGNIYENPELLIC